MSRCERNYTVSLPNGEDLLNELVPVFTAGTLAEERSDDAGGKHYRAINHYYATVALMNPTGYWLMQQTNGVSNLLDIAQQLAAEHDVNTEVALADVKKFVALMRRQKMIFFRGEEPPEVLEVTSATGPQEIWLNVTNACNLRCVHCFRHGGQKFQRELSSEMILKTIASIAALKTGYVVVSGGEPLLRPDIFEILEELKRQELHVLLITNGTRIQEAEAKRLGEIKPWRIQVSVDGSTAEIHDRIRGAGAFDKTINAIRLMLTEDLDVRIYPTIHRWNIHDLKNIKALARSLRPNFEHFAFAKYHPTGRGRDNRDDLDIPDDEFSDALARQFGEDVKHYNLQSDADSHAAKDLTSYLPTRTPYGSRKVNCGLGYGVLSIDADAKVYPCQWLHFPEYLIGDLYETSLDELYFCSAMVQKCRALRVDSSIPTCANCEFKYFCGGGCRAKALTYTDNIAGKDPLCQQYLNGYRQGLWAQSVWPSAAPPQAVP
jgi:radical SAM protein with 4Fe4S-binding SPASM domain